MKKSKRLWLGLLCLLALALALFCMNACGKNADQNANGANADTTADGVCQHTWTEWTAVSAATCTEHGTEQRSCSLCGKSESRSTVPLGHAWGEWTVTEQATCEQAGSQFRTCTNDAAHVETQTLDATGHIYDQEVATDAYLKTEATCTQKAVYFKSCVCGKFETGENAATFAYGPEPSHTYGEWVSAGENVHKRTCTCGHEENAAHTWNEGETLINATHISEGTAKYTCTSCGETKTESLGKLKDHIQGDWTTHSETHHKYVCVCGDTVYALHRWNAGEVTQEPTHTVEGVKTYTCTDCGETKTESIAKTTEHTYGEFVSDGASMHKQVCACGGALYFSHTWNEGKITTEATHTQAGIKTYTCTDCGETKTEKVDRIMGHTYGTWVADGDVHKRTCSCGATETAAHGWNNGVTINATHTSEGKKIYSCTECSATKTETIAKDPTHTFLNWVESGDGHTGECACGETVTKAHTWNDGRETLAPTHISTGEKLYICTVCEAEKTETLKATSAHEEKYFGAWESNGDFSHKRTCECGYVEYLSHTWNAGEVTQAPTHTVEGVKTYTCTACDATKTETLSKTTAHDACDAWVYMDKTYHQDICSCGDKRIASHQWGAGVETSVTLENHVTVTTMVYTCVDCGGTKTEKVGESVSHTLTYQTTEGDLAQHKLVCDCGYEIAEDHAWNDGVVTVEPNHTEKGVKTYTCTSCNMTKTEELPAVTDSTDHTWTWIQNGDKHERTCACGATESEAHKWNDGEVTQAPTHLDEGSKTVKCTVCDATKVETLEKTAEHTFDGEWKQHNSKWHVRYCECGKEEFEAHSWKLTDTIEATHTTTGTNTYTCTACDATKTEEISKTTAHEFGDWVLSDELNHMQVCDCGTVQYLAHTWDDGETTLEPTHTSLGEFTYTCTVCAGKKVESIDKLTDHSYVYEIVDKKYLKTAATCTSYAVYYQSCECGDFVADEDATFEDFKAGYAPDNHTYDQEAAKSDYLKADATCVNKAVYYKSCVCGACDKEVAETFEYGETLDHSYSKVVTPATCEAGGYTTYTCSTCSEGDTNHSYIGDKTRALGHNVVAEVVPNTCTEDGYTKHYCSNTGCTYTEENTDPVPAAHKWVVSTTQPDCNSDGSETKTCSVCGASESKTLASTGHSYDIPVSTQVTCTTNGITEYKCECGEFKTTETGERYQEIVEATGHNAEKGETYVAATCTEAGYTQSVCSCGYINKVVNTSDPATEHDWSVTVETLTTATCTANGSVKMGCSKCDAEPITVTTDKLSHNLQTTNVAATCTANAYTLTACQNENCTYTQRVEAEGTATNHKDTMTTVVVAATCEEQGYTQSHCTACGATETTNVVAPLDHDWSVATCYAASTCQRENCGAVGTAATGIHNYTETLTTAATCTAKGSTLYECSTSGCSASYTVELPIQDHDFEGQTAEIKTTTSIVEGQGCMVQETKCITCNTCEQVIEEPYESYNACKYSKQILTVATCQEQGTVQYTCTEEGCGHSYTDSYTDNNAHTWVATANETEVTNTQKMVCACGATKTVAYTSNGVTADDLDSSDELVVGDASIALSDAAKEAIQSTLGSDGKLSVSANTVELDSSILSEDQVVYDLQMSNGDSTIETFADKITVRIPYTLAEGEDPESIVILYLDENGNKVDEIKATYVVIDGVGYAEFQTDHFSYYTVTRLSPKERCKLYGHINKTVEQKANCLIDGYVINLCTRCGNKETVSETPASGHDWKDTITSATCTEAGKKVTTCANCQLSYNTEIAALGHKLEVSDTDSKAATCIEAGYNLYVCTNENCEYTHKEAIAKLGHTYGEGVVTPATCEKEGYSTFTCQNCPDSYVAKPTKALGHSVKDNVVAPTCIAKGYTEHICEVCGERFENTDETEKSAHKWDLEEPTCGKGQTCEACGTAGKAATGAHEYDEETGICKDETCKKECSHEWYDGDVVEPTCDEDGYTKRFCSHCHKQNKEEGYKDYKKKDHLEHEWKEYDHKDATCNGKGYHDEVCRYCQGHNKQEFDATEHDIVEIVEAATCDKDGRIRYYCRGCQEYVKEDTVVPARGHSYELRESVDATCDNDGRKLHVCKYCDDKREEIEPKKKHELVLTQTVDATCTKAGYQLYVCEHRNCNYKEEVVLEKLAHTLGDPTFQNDSTHKYTCTVCGTTDYAVHEWNKGEITLEPTHTVKGSVTYTCTVCSGTKVEELATTPEHTYGAWMQVDEKTHSRVCACESVETEDHAWNEGVVTAAPTHIAEGKVTYTCTVCAYTKEETLPTTDAHTYEISDQKAASCTEEGYIVYLCACGDTYTETLGLTKHSYIDGVCTSCGDVKGEGCEHSSEPNKTLEYLTTVHSCDGGIRVIYTCSDCEEELKTEYYFEHEYEFEEINLSQHGLCQGAYLEVQRCVLCEEVSADIFSNNCYFNAIDKEYVKNEDGSVQHILTYVCMIHDCSYKFIQTDSVRDGCEVRHQTTYIFAEGTEQELTVETCRIYTNHMTDSKTDEVVSEETDGDGNKWNVVTQTYTRFCTTCGALLDSQISVIRCDEAGDPVSGYMIEQIPLDPFNENCTEFFILGEAYAEVEYTVNENGEKMATSMKQSYVEYNPDGTVADKGVEEERYNEKGERIYSRSDAYRVIDGEDVLVETYEREYTTITLPSGEQTIRTTSFVNICYNLDGSVEKENRETWSYALSETNACKLEITHTNSDGESNTYAEYSHGEMETKYEFNNGGASCSDGIRILETCSACGMTLNEYYDYGHMFEYEEIQLSEYGATCGGTVGVDSCTRCDYKSVMINTVCAFEKTANETVVDENEVKHTVTTYTCLTCGFSYTYDRWTSTENCVKTRNECYRFGIAEDGSAKYEVTAKRLYGASHSIIREEPVNTTVTEEDASGRTLTVTTVETVNRCENCSYVQSHSAVVTKMDQDGNILYEEVCNYATDSEGEQYVYEKYLSQNEVAALENGESFIYELLNLHEVYDAEGTVISFYKYVYTYKDGDYCHPTVTYTNHYGNESVSEEIYHRGEKMEYEFAEGVTNCEQGVTIKYICTVCGETISTDTVYHHMTDGEIIDLTQYGSTCGTKIYVYSCPCGFEQGWHFDEWNCKFEESLEGRFDEATEAHHNVWTYTCINCGFSYSEDQWEETDKESCRTTDHLNVRFGIDKEGNCTLEYQLILGTYYSHSTEYKELVNETTTEKDENGRELTVQTTESAYVCLACGATENRNKSVTKTDENGNVLYTYSATYQTSNGVEYLESERTYTYEVATLESGEAFVYQTGYSYYGYNVNGEKVSGFADVYVYEDGAFCKRTVTRTYYYGGENVYTEEKHASTKAEYVFPEGSTSCDTGVIRKYVCVACGVTTNEYTIYYHENTWEYISLSEFGAACGGSIELYTCPCGKQQGLNVFTGCSITEQGETIEVDGVKHDKWTYTCTNENCGFAYSYEYWSESGANCTSIDHRVYRFGIDAEGNAKLEKTIVINNGENHSWGWDTLENSSTTEEDESGNKLTVEVYEERLLCKGCGSFTNHSRNVTKLDADGNIVYRQIIVYEKDENGVEFKATENVTKYEMLQLENGSTKHAMTEETDTQYDVNGEKTYWWARAYAYDLKNPCVVSVTYTDSNGVSETTEQTSHGNTNVVCELMEGATLCTDGIWVRTICADCGTVISEYEEYYHRLFTTLIDATEFGSVCGAQINVRACACGYQTSVSVKGGCSFTNTNQSYVDDNGDQHYYYIYTCRNEGCGFTYTREWWTEYDESCNRLRVNVYRFGVDAEGNAKYEMTWNQTLGVSHTYVDTVISDESTTETDANGNALTVKTTVSHSACERCGTVVNENWQYVKVEKTDANGNVVYLLEQNRYSDESNEYVEKETLNEYVAVLQKDGTYLTYPTLEQYKACNPDGSVWDSYQYVYTYTDGNYCSYKRTYTDRAGNEEVYEETNHAKTEQSYEFINGSYCENGVQIIETCISCGEKVGEYTTYGHDYDYKTVGVAEIGATCAGQIEVNTCKRCAYTTVYNSLSCVFKQERILSEKDEATGYRHIVDAYTCATCGFVYTLETQYELEGTCKIYLVRTYCYGVAEDGTCKLQVVSRQYWQTAHSIVSEETEKVESTETDANGNTLTVKTWEYKHSCSECGYVSDLYHYVEKYDADGNRVYYSYLDYDIDSNGNAYPWYGYVYLYDQYGNILYEETSYYYNETDENGAPIVRDQNIYEYAVAVREDGSFRRYTTKYTYNYYNMLGELINSVNDVYTYVDGNYCEYTVTRTEFDGSSTDSTGESHPDYQYVYVLVEGATDCGQGVLRAQICKDCGKEISSTTVYYHYTFSQQYVLNSSCGDVTVSIMACACGYRNSESLNVQGNCVFNGHSEQIEDANGIVHTFYTNSCSTCGLTYTRDIWSEYDAECNQVRYTQYRIGVSADGTAQYEKTYTRNYGVSHDLITSYNDPVVSEEDGLKVTTTTATVTCSRCNKLMNVETTVSKVDADGNEVYYGYQRQDPTTEVEGGLYLAYETRYTYGVFTDKGGNIRRYTISAYDVSYDVNKAVLYSNLYEYTYTDGNYCTATCKHTDANENVYEDTVTNHISTTYIYVLSEGNTSCKEGTDRVYLCTECGTEIDRVTNWSTGHNINRHEAVETIDLAQYGCVCGGYAYVYACACGDRQNLTIDANCLFDTVQSYWYTGDDNVERHGYLYGCAVTDPTLCGFKYLKLNYTTCDENCYGYQHYLYLFGYNAETGEYAGKWEESYATGNISHSFKSSHESYEAADGGQVSENKYACSNCGVINYIDRDTYYSAENAEYYRTYEYLGYHTGEGGNYLERRNFVGYKLQRLESGESREVTAMDRQERYNAEGTMTSWDEHTYDYSESYCKPVATYRNSNGEETTNSDYENHWLNWNEEVWKDGEASCTQEGTRLMGCYCCDYVEENYYSHYGHSYSYNYITEIYECTRCGLENFTGADGYVLLEDLTNRLGDGTKYVVGYYNRHFDEYLFSVVLVVGEEEHYLDVEATVDGSLVYIDAQAIVDAAKALEIDACQYMVRLNFVPVEADGEYDFAITLDPHVYKRDDANSVVAEDPCYDAEVNAYVCACCGDNYQTSVIKGHQYTTQTYLFGECGKYYLHINTCTVCGNQESSGFGWNDKPCNFEGSVEKNEFDSVSESWHEVIRYTCTECGFVYLLESYHDAADGCNRTQHIIYSWDLQEDGTFGETLHLTNRYESHGTSQEVVSTETVTDADGNQTTTTVYAHKCSCGYVGTRSYITETVTAEGVKLSREECHMDVYGNENLYRYEYIVGEDGGVYVASYYYRGKNVNDSWIDAWLLTYTYDFETMTRSYKRVYQWGHTDTGYESFTSTATVEA